MLSYVRPQCNENESTKSLCASASVSSFPMWVVGGTAVKGVVSPGQLRSYMAAVDDMTTALAQTDAVVYGRDSCIWYAFVGRQHRPSVDVGCKR